MESKKKPGRKKKECTNHKLNVSEIRDMNSGIYVWLHCTKCKNKYKGVVFIDDDGK